MSTIGTHHYDVIRPDDATMTLSIICSATVMAHTGTLYNVAFAVSTITTCRRMERNLKNVWE